MKGEADITRMPPKNPKAPSQILTTTSSPSGAKPALPRREQYLSSAERYDEAFVQQGEAREHWRLFQTYLEGLDRAQLQQIVRENQRAIEADGVTYTVYDQGMGADRPWALDPLPLIVPTSEWIHIEAGIAQRARLLNALLKDIYGPQTLIAEGYLPPALVFGHHGFLWPCHGIIPPHGIFLHNYAADLARSPDGRWWVIADRTQAPSGAGYALQNRYIVARGFNQSFRDLRVQHLAGFFATQQESLKTLCASEGEAPFIILLTPGPYNETYFEHAFLARQLGFPLVEGQDLSVRGNKVYLKTLGGLRRVHGIVRRLDDDFCDPVELRSDSALGVPGLLAAARAGEVLISNALGTGVLENAALQGFLPAICRKLLGEDLILPSIATWWCGEAPALSYAIKNLQQLVVKPAFPSMHSHAVFGHRLQGANLTETVARVCANPHAWVAQEWVRLSQAPVLDTNLQLVPRTLGLRAFACATQDGYKVMPGGLARVAGETNPDVISMQRGGSSKDVWVLTQDALVRHRLIKARLSAADVVHKPPHIPARIVENLYWMGRYSERCEASTRLLRTIITSLAEFTEDDKGEIQALTSICQNQDLLDSKFEPQQSSLEKLELALLTGIYESEFNNSLQANLQRLLWCSSHLRERLSSDNWHALNRMTEVLKPPSDVPRLSDALGTLDWMMLGLSSLTGFAMDSMTHDEGWHFLILGRRIERLSFFAQLLSHYLHLPAKLRLPAMESVLKIFNSIVTYRARYQRRPELLACLYLIAFDLDNPHSISFQVDALRRNLQQLARETGQQLGRQLDSIALELAHFDLASLEHSSAIAFSTSDKNDSGATILASLLNETEHAAQLLNEELTHHFFMLAEQNQQARYGMGV